MEIFYFFFILFNNLFSSNYRYVSIKTRRQFKALIPPPLIDIVKIQVVTDRHIYRLDGKTFKIHKQPIPLTQVQGFAISSGEDQACIVRLVGDTDLVVTLRGDACAAELVTLATNAKGEEYVFSVSPLISFI